MTSQLPVSVLHGFHYNSAPLGDQQQALSLLTPMGEVNMTDTTDYG